ncbi:hypothetical protein [Kitasatospora sp. MMS16-BH015]|nr:hypothetical protein [Kitasatospora sp. MMS16-BH015]
MYPFPTPMPGPLADTGIVMIPVAVASVLLLLAGVVLLRVCVQRRTDRG